MTRLSSDRSRNDTLASSDEFDNEDMGDSDENTYIVIQYVCGILCYLITLLLSLKMYLISKICQSLSTIHIISNMISLISFGFGIIILNFSGYSMNSYTNIDAIKETNELFILFFGLGLLTIIFGIWNLLLTNIFMSRIHISCNALMMFTIMVLCSSTLSVSMMYSSYDMDIEL